MRRIRLPQRVDGAPLPPVEVVDLKESAGAIHPRTHDALVDARKAIVLLNRRGWSNFLTCRSCGRVWQCPQCDVALVLHRADRAVACHHCGHREPVPSVAHYVAWKLDPRDSRKIMQIGYDPDATKGTRPKRLWSSEEERFLEGDERLEALVQAYRQEKNGGRRLLLAHERREVEEHLAGGPGTNVGVLSATQAKIEMLTRMKQTRATGAALILAHEQGDHRKVVQDEPKVTAYLAETRKQFEAAPQR